MPPWGMHPNRTSMFQLGSQGLSSFPPSHTASHARTDGWAGAQGTGRTQEAGDSIYSLWSWGREGKRGERVGFFLCFFFFCPTPAHGKGFCPQEVSGSTRRSVLEGVGRCREAAGRARLRGEEQKTPVLWLTLGERL